MSQLIALVIYLLCAANGVDCLFVKDAHITEYVPELGGNNCSEPCDMTAFMTPVIYGETAACGPTIPYGTRVYIEGVGWRTCQDRGGAIDDDEVDVAVRPAEYLRLGIGGYRDVVWLLPNNGGIRPVSRPTLVPLRYLALHGARNQHAAIDPSWPN